MLCQPGDGTKLRERGVVDVTEVSPTATHNGVELHRTGGRPGHGELAEQMGAVSGFVLRAHGEPSIYVTGDTVWCDEVEAALAEHRPDVVVVNAGAATFTGAPPIVMDSADVVRVADAAPDAVVVAVHLEAVNHCIEGREALRTAVSGRRVAVPEDGETLPLRVSLDSAPRWDHSGTALPSDRRTMSAKAFDPVVYKETTREQWQDVAAAWHRWSEVIDRWLGPATEVMLHMAGIREGSRVLDVAAGAGGQSLVAARRVGPGGSVLATDISSNLLYFAAQRAREAGLGNVETAILDGERLDVQEASFDAVISRVGFIYFPDQQAALRGMWRALKPGGKLAGIVYSTAQANEFFSVPVSIIRRRAELPPPAPGQPGPFSFGESGVIEGAYERAGFTAVETRRMSAPLRLASAAECLRFQQESFGALHQMLAGLSDDGRADAWAEIERALERFERDGGFEAPCELIIAAGTR